MLASKSASTQLRDDYLKSKDGITFRSRFRLRWFMVSYTELSSRRLGETLASPDPLRRRFTRGVS